MLLLLSLPPDIIVHAVPADSLLKTARLQFYAGVRDASKLPEAVSLFEVLSQDSALQGRATVYLGALEALRGKHAVFPMAKYKHAVRGLELMDQGLRMAPDDIESLFIHGSTCFYLPLFFGRKDDALQSFRNLIQLLPEHYHDYEETIVSNVIEFLIENAELSAEEETLLLIIQYQLDFE
jgi:hypothetical protein